MESMRRCRIGVEASCNPSCTVQASLAIERLSLAAAAPTCGATCAELLASKARHVAELLQLTLDALRSDAEAREAREVTTHEPKADVMI